PAGRGLGLRALANLIGASLLVMALVGCVALIVLTTRLRIEAERTEEAAVRVRGADGVGLRLLDYARASDLDVVSASGEHELARAEAEAALLRRTDDLLQLHPHEGLVGAQDVVARVRDYVRARRAAELRYRTRLVEIVEAANPSLDAA